MLGAKPKSAQSTKRSAHSQQCFVCLRRSGTSILPFQLTLRFVEADSVPAADVNGSDTAVADAVANGDSAANRPCNDLDGTYYDPDPDQSADTYAICEHPPINDDDMAAIRPIPPSETNVHTDLVNDDVTNLYDELPTTDGQLTQQRKNHTTSRKASAVGADASKRKIPVSIKSLTKSVKGQFIKPTRKPSNSLAVTPRRVL